MATFLVTGGAGFIGAHIVFRLVKEGQTVVVLDNLSTGYIENLAAVASNITFIKGDIRDYAAVQAAMQGVDYVFHEAALTSVGQSIDDPLETAAVNTTGTLQLLVAARDARVKRFVFASSSAVYGSSRGMVRETNRLRPISPYGVSKLVAEHYCRIFSELYDLPTVCLRYFNVFGPRQSYQSGYAAVIPTFIRQLLQNEILTIHGPGNQTRDFTYVDNIVEANFRALTATAPRSGEFNIGSSTKTSINQLVERLHKITGNQRAAVHKSPRPGDILSSQASIARAKRVLRYEPTVSLDEGLGKTLAWYQGVVTTPTAEQSDI